MKTIVNARPRIVVLGGGFGGLEAALYLRSHMQAEADVTLVSDKEYFLFKPNTIYVPFGLEPRKLLFHLSRPARSRDINLVNSFVREVDPISKSISLDGRNQVSTLSYDFLIVATGAQLRPEEIPGLREFANIIGTVDQMMQLRASFQKLAVDASEGQVRDVLFVVPPNNKCSGPLYEIAMMLDTWLRHKKVRDRVAITWSTYEESYIQTSSWLASHSSARLHDLVTHEFEQRGITGYTQYVVDSVESNEVVYKNHERLPFHLVVSFSPYAAASHFAGLPIDERGFIATDLGSRQVVGYPDVYAVGDVSDFPMKQAFMASLQADAAADHLTAQILGKAPVVNFDPVGMPVIEELAQATFTRAHLSELSMKAPKLAEVHRNPESLYRVGSSLVSVLRPSRFGKMALGFYLPWRFKSGNPFYAGAPWKGLEANLRLASGALADRNGRI
jgi:sulfide:quinone oxidoreductase